MSERHDYPINRWCALLPDMKPKEFEEFKGDIEQNGLKERIELIHNPETGEDEVVDGRHRLRALRELGIELTEEHFVHLDSNTDVPAHVLSRNVMRRQLSTGAKAELARKFSLGSTRGGDRRSAKRMDHSAFLPNGRGAGTVTQEQSGRAFGVSVRSIGQAGLVFDDDSTTPETVREAVRTDELTLSDVAKVADRPPEVQDRALEAVRNREARTLSAAVRMLEAEPSASEPDSSTGDEQDAGQRFPTIVVDPPWPVMKPDMETANSADAGYEPMSIGEIGAMRLPIEEDAAVFLWCPPEHLPAGFRILEGWGVEYRTILIWRKEEGGHPLNPGGSNLEFVVLGTQGDPQINLGALSSAIFPGHCPDPWAPCPEKPPEFDGIFSMIAPGPRLTLPGNTAPPPRG